MEHLSLLKVLQKILFRGYKHMEKKNLLPSPGSYDMLVHMTVDLTTFRNAINLSRCDNLPNLPEKSEWIEILSVFRKHWKLE